MPEYVTLKLEVKDEAAMKPLLTGGLREEFPLIYGGKVVAIAVYDAMCPDEDAHKGCSMSDCCGVEGCKVCD